MTDWLEDIKARALNNVTLSDFGRLIAEVENLRRRLEQRKDHVVQGARPQFDHIALKVEIVRKAVKLTIVGPSEMVEQFEAARHSVDAVVKDGDQITYVL